MKQEGLELAGRLALRPREAARSLGLSERKLREILPELPHVRVGGAVLIPVDALRSWLADRAESERRRADAIAESVIGEIQRAHR